MELRAGHAAGLRHRPFPDAAAGAAIALWARLFAVIDTPDAMTSDRPDRKGLSFDAARTGILRLAGTQFDPVALDAFELEEATLRNMVGLKCGTATSVEKATLSNEAELHGYRNR